MKLPQLMTRLGKFSLADFAQGDWVAYVPNHARPADSNDRDRMAIAFGDVELGVVSSRNESFVFVKFRPTAASGMACDPADLVKVFEE